MFMPVCVILQVTEAFCHQISGISVQINAISVQNKNAECQIEEYKVVF